MELRTLYQLLNDMWQEEVHYCEVSSSLGSSPKTTSRRSLVSLVKGFLKK